MNRADSKAALGSTHVAALMPAKTLLERVPGFLYLPIFVPDALTGQEALAYLMQSLPKQPLVVDWPLTEPDLQLPKEQQALGQLLHFLDQAISSQGEGGTVVLNACGLERQDLAYCLAPYLNYRRDALRQWGLRLLLLWPSQAELRQHLIDSAPDLWAVRAASPILDPIAVVPESTEALIPYSDKEGSKSTLPPYQSQQLACWNRVEKTSQADLSYEEALHLLAALHDARQWQELDQFARRLLDELHNNPQEQEPQQKQAMQAKVMDYIGVSKSHLGDTQGALYWSNCAVEIYEQLAKEIPAAYAPTLAKSLNNLMISLAEVGKREEALAAILHAIEIYEQLIKGNHAAYAPYLAATLNNFSVRLAEAGQREEALAAIRRAVKIYEQLAKDNHAAYAPYLAACLNNSSAHLAEAGERKAALAASHQAIEIYEQLVRDGHAAYTSDLASSLNNLSIHLAKMGNWALALEANHRAVVIYEQLSKDSHSNYSPDLAKSLNNLSNRLAEVGERENALAASGRAVEIYERLAHQTPAAYVPDLAKSLNNFSIHLAKAGQREEALEAAERACDLIAPFALPNTPYANWYATMQQQRDKLLG